MRQKRFLSWLLTLCLLLGMFSFPAYAEGNTTTISGDGTAEKTGTMTVTLVIPKKTPAATDLTYTAPSELTYSGSDKVATVAAASGVTGLGNITVKYYSDASRTIEAAPKNVGTYYVGATIAEGDEYAASTAVLYGDGWTFTITASTPSAPAAPTKASATKNSITLNAASGCEYSKDGVNWQSGTEFTGLLPGTEYTFYKRVKATANTNASSASSASFSTEADTYAMTITLVIKPAQTITASDVTAAYGDTDKSVSASVTEPTTGGGAISYAVKEGSGDYIDVAADGKLTIKAVPPTDGKAYVIVTAAETDDYAEATKEVVVTISRAEVTVTAKDQSIYVGGTVPTLEGEDFYTVTGLVGEDVLTTAPTLAYQKDGSAATPDNTTAGTYDIVASGAAASDNYTITYANGMLTISNKGTQTISAENVTATYGDTEKSVSATVTDPATGGGAISYSVKDGSEDYINVDTSTGALTIKAVPADGKAYVTVTAAETATYAPATKDVTVTINKANAVAATVTANNRTYDGTEKSLVTVDDSALVGGEMKYALGTDTTTAPADNLYATSIPTKTNAGTYYVWSMVKGDGNHKDSTPTAVVVSIEKADIHPVVTIKSWKVDADAQTPQVTGNTENGKVTYTYSVKGENNYQSTVPESAGLYTVKASIEETANYRSGEAVANFSIMEERPNTVTWDTEVLKKLAMTTGDDPFTQGGVTLEVLNGTARYSNGVSFNGFGFKEDSFRFLSDRYIAEIKITGKVRSLKWTGAKSEDGIIYWTGSSTSIDFGKQIESVKKIEFTLGDYPKEMPDADFETPGALKWIDEEAFEGIAARNVRISDGTKGLGSRAFADCSNLKAIFIPESVEAIPDDLLDGCGEVKVYGTGDKAKTFAENNGHVFIQVQ